MFTPPWSGNCFRIEGSHWRDDRRLVSRIFQKSHRADIVSMANLLWRDELLEICGARHRTRWVCICWLKEYGRLADFRKQAIKQLVARPLSKWETAFWERYDGAENNGVMTS